MPNQYSTLPVGSHLIAGKTEAYLLIPISSNIDTGSWWQKCGGSAESYLKATVKKQDTTPIEKLAENLEIFLDNSAPQLVKVLFLANDFDVAQTLKILVEFKFDDGWVQADSVDVKVIAA
jgi:hypothetical protein